MPMLKRKIAEEARIHGRAGITVTCGNCKDQACDSRIKGKQSIMNCPRMAEGSLRKAPLDYLNQLKCELENMDGRITSLIRLPEDAKEGWEILNDIANKWIQATAKAIMAQTLNIQISSLGNALESEVFRFGRKTLYEYRRTVGMEL